MGDSESTKTSGTASADVKRLGPYAKRSVLDSDASEMSLLSPDEAAVIAKRSVRTIRRAYRAGRLRAHRDGNGHGVRIRYSDLRKWMMATSAAAPVLEPQEEKMPPPQPRLDMSRTTLVSDSSNNVTLLNAARARLQRGDAPCGGGSRRSEAPADAHRA